MKEFTNKIPYVKSITLSILFFFLAVASGNGGSSSSSSSSSPYSNYSEAYSICSSELRSSTNSGSYNHLNDYEMMKRMDEDLEDCMKGYGHYPN